MNIRWAVPAAIWGLLLFVAALAFVGDQYRPLGLLARAAAVALNDPVLLVLALAAGFFAPSLRVFFLATLAAIGAAAAVDAWFLPVAQRGGSLAAQFVAGFAVASLTWAFRPRETTPG